MSFATFRRHALSTVILLGFSCVGADSFDFFTFTLQWPVTFCKMNQHKCNMNTVPDNWIIHGLWPSNFTGANPRNCSSFFDVSQIPQNIAEEMNRQWPNLNKNEANDQFWDKQWRMHGSCAESVPGVQNIGEYFTKVITLANMYNIKKILNSRGITEGNQYTTATIQDAIVLNTTKLSKIIGLKSKCTKDWLLFEIRICFDKQFEVINCPNVTNSTLKLRYPSKPSPAAQALRCDVSSNGHSTSQFLSLIAYLIASPFFLMLKV